MIFSPKHSNPVFWNQSQIVIVIIVRNKRTDRIKATCSDLNNRKSDDRWKRCGLDSPAARLAALIPPGSAGLPIKLLRAPRARLRSAAPSTTTTRSGLLLHLTHDMAKLQVNQTSFFVSLLFFYRVIAPRVVTYLLLPARDFFISLLL